jgi:integrase
MPTTFVQPRPRAKTITGVVFLAIVLATAAITFGCATARITPDRTAELINAPIRFTGVIESFAEYKVGAFTLHDLRRTVRTGLATLGIRPDIAERCLNHAQPGIIVTYDSHHYLEEKRDALTQWTNHLQALRDGK